MTEYHEYACAGCGHGIECHDPERVRGKEDWGPECKEYAFPEVYRR